MDDHSEVRLLLSGAAEQAGPFQPPPVAELVRRRSQQSRTRAGLVVAISVVAVVAVAVGLAWGGAHRATQSPTPARLSLPSPHGPQVTVSHLKDYRWAAMPAAPIPARSSAASVWTGGRLLVWGGQGPDDTLYGDGASYDPVTRTWATLPPSPLTPRVGAQAVWVGGAFVVWGGITAGDGTRAVDGARYDVATGSWTRLPAAPVRSYGWAHLVVAGGQAVLLTAAGDGASGDVQADAYDPARNAWLQLPDLPGVPGQEFYDGTTTAAGSTVLLWRYWHHESSRTVGNRIDVTSGGGADTYALDVKAGHWTSVPLDPDRGTRSVQALWTGREVILPEEGTYCGVCRGGPMRSSIPGVAIDPQTGARTTIAGGPVSTGANYVWTGAALLGMNMSTRSEDSDHHVTLRPGDAAAWDPTTHRWTSLRGSDIRGNASGAVTVWTGHELLIWGVTKVHGIPGTATAGLAFSPPGG